MPYGHRGGRRGGGVFRGFQKRDAWIREETIFDFGVTTVAHNQVNSQLLIPGPATSARQAIQYVREMSVNVSAIQFAGSLTSRTVLLEVCLGLSDSVASFNAAMVQAEVAGFIRKKLTVLPTVGGSLHIWAPRGFRLTRDAVNPFNEAVQVYIGMRVVNSKGGAPADDLNIVGSCSYRTISPNSINSATALDLASMTDDQLRALKEKLSAVHPLDCDCNWCQLQQATERESQES